MTPPTDKSAGDNRPPRKAAGRSRQGIKPTPPASAAGATAEESPQGIPPQIAPPQIAPPRKRAKDGTMRGNPEFGYTGAAGGRASFKLDEELLRKLVGYTQMGNYKSTAAKACGIGRETMYRWNKEGEKVYLRMVEEFGQDVADEYDWESTTGPWDDEAECHPNEWMMFRCWFGMNKAEAEAELYAVGQVRAAMGENWTAAMTWLERKYPDRWKRRDLHEVAAVAAAENRGDEDALLAPEAQEALEAAMDAETKAIDAESTAVEEPR